MTCRHNSRSVLFQTLHNEKGQEVHDNYINGFSEKIIFGAIGPFWLQNDMPEFQIFPFNV